MHLHICEAFGLVKATVHPSLPKNKFEISLKTQLNEMLEEPLKISKILFAQWRKYSKNIVCAMTEIFKNLLVELQVLKDFF